MATWVCAIERRERGGVIERVRLIGPGDRDATWQRTSEEPDEAPRAAAEWVREHVRKGRVRVVVDTDGGVCSWLTVPGGEAHVLEAMVRQATGSLGEGGNEAAAPGVLAASVLGPDAAIPGGATVQALAEPDTQRDGTDDDRRRKAVIAVPDASVRLTLDAMDQLGVDVAGVWTVWDALSEAWDPASRERGASDAVATDFGVTAVVLVEPHGRLAWSWSRQGATIAAGAMRVGTTGGGEDPHEPVVRESNVGRLISEWLGWGAQLGAVPRRVALLMPPAESGLSAAAVGRQLAAAWDDVGVDVLGEEDPLGRTLRAWRELDDEESADAGTLHALSERPGRGHRGLYRWAAAAVFTLAGIVGVAAWQTWGSVGEARDTADDLRAERLELIRATDQALLLEPDPVGALLSRVEQLRRARAAPPEVQSLWPVLNELDTLTLVLMGVPMELQSIELNQFNASLVGVVPDTESYEALREGLRSIDGNIEEWTGSATDARGNAGALQASFTGRWPIEVPQFEREGTP